jgi:hypothetical protein
MRPGLQQRHHNSVTNTMTNIHMTRDQIARAGGVALRETLTAELEAQFRGWIDKLDPVTKRPLVVVRKLEGAIWRVRVTLFNGHFIEFTVAFDGKLRVLSTAPMDLRKRHDIVFDSMEMDSLNTTGKAISLWVNNDADDPTLENRSGVFAMNLVEKFVEEAGNLDEYDEPKTECECACRHEQAE